MLSANDRIVGKPPLGHRENSANARVGDITISGAVTRTQKSFRISHKQS